MPATRLSVSWLWSGVAHAVGFDHLDRHVERPVGAADVDHQRQQVAGFEHGCQRQPLQAVAVLGAGDVAVGGFVEQAVAPLGVVLPGGGFLVVDPEKRGVDARLVGKPCADGVADHAFDRAAAEHGVAREVARAGAQHRQVEVDVGHRIVGGGGPVAHRGALFRRAGIAAGQRQRVLRLQALEAPLGGKVGDDALDQVERGACGLGHAHHLGDTVRQRPRPSALFSSTLTRCSHSLTPR